MEFRELFDRTPEQIRELTEVWGRSVRATHGFLTEAEIRRIRGYVPHALAEVPYLVAAEEKGRYPVFLGASEGMLFLAPEERGKGIGRQLFLWSSCRFAAEGRKKEVPLGGKKGRFRERKGTLREKERFSAAFKNCF